MSAAKKIFVPYALSFKKNFDGVLFANAVDDERTKVEEGAVEVAVSQGWRIVSTVPLTTSVGGPNGIFQYTSGYEVWLQRD